MGTKMDVVWRNVIIYSFLHAAGLYGFILLPQSHFLTKVWGLFYYLISALGITAGAHRLWSHRSYTAKTPLRILLALMNSAALQNSIYEWCRDHRVHHKYSETDADPHNAKRGFFFAHMGWLLVRKHPDVITKGKQIPVQDLLDDPVVMIQKRYYMSSVLIMCILVPTMVPYFILGESLINSFFVCAVLRYVTLLHSTWSVNSAAHMWGNRPYDTSINPRENNLVTWLAIGEGFHNYHHVFPYDYAASEFGLKWNLTTLFIDVCAFLGMVEDRKSVSHNMILQRQARTGAVHQK